MSTPAILAGPVKALTLSLAFAASLFSQGIVQSWTFNDPAATPLTGVVNAGPGVAAFSVDLPGVATNGAGALVFAYAEDFTSRSFATIPAVTTGTLRLDVVVGGWNFAGVGAPEAGPLLEIGFAAVTVGGNTDIRTAHIYIEADNVNNVLLAGVAGNAGGDGGSPAASTALADDRFFDLVRTTPITFRLTVNLDTLEYSISHSDDDYASLATGTIASGKGANFISIRALDDFTIGGTGGNLTIDSLTLSYTPPAAPLGLLETWRQTFFGVSEDSGNAADAADPDGDGTPNLIEYATGTDPTVTNPAPVALARNSAGFLTLAFSSIADPALTYEVLGSTMLATDSWLPVFSETGATLGTGPQIVTDITPISAQPRRFLKLRVTR